ncbi:Iml3p LALA0_S03e04984g [Lachancea lanzarotensis]|uniref:LALA0S03e04984g1_1 n=1 Tax=Lachancea lanzarotensis TaxID=1245769 RepID=A0A0C7MVI1_9SACH|nr:uncharacterized protein LALA0_S03e04984g [Lachancea lanzarotensis]CEP61533.1 LALA0S03e04984g1_1 [Lachancea lanzarotensis]
MVRRQNWQCWLVTQLISERVLLSFIDELDRRTFTPIVTKPDNPQLKCWHIELTSKNRGEVIIHTGKSEDDEDDSNSQTIKFPACFLSDDEDLGILLRNWIAQHTDSFVEKMEFQNSLMIAIADCVLQQGSKGVRVLYQPQTQRNHLKRLEFDFAEADVQELVQTCENTEKALSNCIFPYLQSQTGIRCHALPLSEIRIQDRLVVTSRSLGTLDGDGTVLKKLARPLLNLFNAHYQEAIAKNP